MVELMLALFFSAVLVTLSLRADARLRQEHRLPMQWSFSGEVNWTAPRRWALAFTPVLAIPVLLVTAIAMQIWAPRQGQEGYEVPVLIIMGTGFLAVHLLHLALIARQLRRDRP